MHDHRVGREVMGEGQVEIWEGRTRRAVAGCDAVGVRGGAHPVEGHVERGQQRNPSRRAAPNSKVGEPVESEELHVCHPGCEDRRLGGARKEDHATTLAEGAAPRIEGGARDAMQGHLDLPPDETAMGSSRPHGGDTPGGSCGTMDGAGGLGTESRTVDRP